ncbi:acyltransferase family protein [Phreatobacter sp. AB_2022a]|uniref:acyltransferase family protein n=1 Tax=Phreatobacter sp. AB_2022a TaxID=3003134 RepID=UPI002286D84B|nr:acyltransferase [Phreatobacter sp. AB_2022a]MCZ0734870.1 acyltransferase [Phreatobacter sp. AB_2022a]
MTQVLATTRYYSTARKSDEVLSIQYLRGLAAFSVLATHTLQWPLLAPNMGLLKTGRFGVEIFFVVSGFIITLVAGDGRFDPKDFLLRRIFRIVPAYWIATFLVLALALIMPQQFRNTVPTLEGLFKSLLFIPSIDPKAPLLLLGWTLDYEAFFYVAFAALFFLSSGIRTLVLCLAFAALVGIGQFAQEPGFLQSFYTSASLVGFCAGMLVAQAYRHGLIDWLAARANAALLAVAAMLVTLFYVVPWPHAGVMSLWLHLLMAAAAVSIVLVGLSVERAGLLPRIGLLRYFGDASYSVYLFHLFPIGAIWALARGFVPIDQTLYYLLASFVAIVACTVFSLISYHLIERPFLIRSRAWHRTPVPA